MWLQRAVDWGYQKIVDVYNNPDATDEDRQIDIFGFSRGGAQSRELANKLLDEGIPVTRESRRWVPSAAPAGGSWKTERNTQWVKPNIRYLGIFDTVPAHGLPGDPGSFYQDLFAGYGQRLDVEKIGAIRHAVAANEARYFFDLVSIKNCATCELAGNAKEEFFAGAHSDIGGGYGISEGGNSAAIYALAWQYTEAQKAGVPLRARPDLDNVLPQARANFINNFREIHDSRYSTMEKLTDRYERTVYYGSYNSSEVLTFDEMTGRAYRFAKTLEGVITEGEDGQTRVIQSNR